jgi:hypothetical protein
MSSTFGSDITLQTIAPNQIQVNGKALFTECCACCSNGSFPRTYFYVLENAYEVNMPKAFMCFTPNFICPGTDQITKVYFDRGPWDVNNCARRIGCLKGEPTFYSHNRKRQSLFI